VTTASACNATLSRRLLLADAPGDTEAPRDTEAPGVIGALPEGRLRRVAAHIDRNLDRNLRLVDLGAVVHMSPYHFARLFKKATGQSPHRFILLRRIAVATALLADSTSSIGSIARSVGFTTASHFTTTFRRLTGVTPTAYRRGHALDAIAADMAPAAPSTARLPDQSRTASTAGSAN
jgi:AraC family transcriptional regulator